VDDRAVGTHVDLRPRPLGERLAGEEATVPAEMAQQRRPPSPVEDVSGAVGCEREVVNGAVEVGMDG